MIETIYEHLGVGIVFQSVKGWKDDQAVIEYLYYFEKEGDPACGSCLKKSPGFFTCQACKIIKYCSKECKEKHYGSHKVFCQEGD